MKLCFKFFLSLYSFTLVYISLTQLLFVFLDNIDRSHRQGEEHFSNGTSASMEPVIRVSDFSPICLVDNLSVSWHTFQEGSLCLSIFIWAQFLNFLHAGSPLLKQNHEKRHGVEVFG